MYCVKVDKDDLALFFGMFPSCRPRGLSVFTAMDTEINKKITGLSIGLGDSVALVLFEDAQTVEAIAKNLQESAAEMRQAVPSMN